MGILDKLKQCFVKEIPEPVATWNHPSLGDYVWDASSESWVGACGSYTVSFSFEKSSEPDVDAVDLAARLFSNPTLFNNGVVQAKAEAKRSFASHLEGEIEGLSVQAIHFCLCPDGEAMVVGLAGGTQGRNWSADFVGWDCHGLSHDG